MDNIKVFLGLHIFIRKIKFKLLCHGPKWLCEMPCSSMLPKFPVVYVEGDLLWDEQTKDIIHVCVYVPGSKLP